jgi:hypothetical protein
MGLPMILPAPATRGGQSETDDMDTTNPKPLSISPVHSVTDVPGLYQGRPCRVRLQTQNLQIHRLGFSWADARPPAEPL